MAIEIIKALLAAILIIFGASTFLICVVCIISTDAAVERIEKKLYELIKQEGEQ